MTTTRSEVTSQRSTRERLLLPALVLMATTPALVSSLGAPLVPEVAAARGVPLGAAQWTLTAAVLVGAVASPLLGTLGGFRRRRTVLVGGLAVVMLGLLVAALPVGFTGLVIGRAMQGVGLGLAPLAIAVARDALPAPRIPNAIALLSVANVAGAGLGFPVAAVVAERAGLAAAYWLGFAVTLMTLVLVAAVVPRSSVLDGTPVDWVGAALLALGSAGLLVTLSTGGSWGWSSAGTLALAVGSVVMVTAWVFHTTRTPHPLVDLRLAVRRGVLGANLTALVAGAGMYLLISLVMVLSQTPTSTGGLGLSLTVAGLLLVPYSFASVLGNRVTLGLRTRISADLLLPIGAAVYLLAVLLLARWHDHAWQLFVAMLVAGIGSGCTFAATPGLIVRFVPLEETGSAMAFNQLLRYLGFSIGSALTPVLLTAYTGGGPTTSAAFTATILSSAVFWVVTGIGTLLLALRVRP